MNHTCAPSPEKPAERVFGVVHELKPSLGDVDELAAADLADPGVEWPVAVREKGHELSVRRDRRVSLLACEIGETLDRGVGQRVLPEVILLPQAPDTTRRDQDSDSCNAREHCPLPLSTSQ